MFKDYPGEIYVARQQSPMIIGVKGDESFIASDVPAILKSLDQDLVKGALSGAHFLEYFDANATDEAIKTAVHEILGK